MKQIVKKLFLVIFGLIIGLVVCEIILHFYNPFPFAISKGKLVLPANQKTVFKNTWIKKLDSNIYYSRNSMGFRGPEAPDSISRILSVICVGGSTTECHFISDSLTWPSQLYTQLKDSLPNIWLNNAGLDGHSTFGHILLTKEYIARLKPKFATYLIGINDVENDKPSLFDLMNEKGINFFSVKSFFKSIANKTILGSTIFQLYAVRGAYKKGLIHKDVDFASLKDTVLSEAYCKSILQKQTAYLDKYKQRIDTIVTICKANGVKPILITQPSMFGNFTDSATGVQMANKISPNQDYIANAALNERVLEMYNDVVRSYSATIKVIDLAKQMPKNSNYYYDFIHFTNQGCKMVATILYKEMLPYINTNK